jgi:translation initiation factor 1
MPAKPPSRLVFSSERPTCPKCGWPRKECRCAATFDQPVPEKLVVVLRVEKSGRGGKTVTVVDGLPKNSEFVAKLAVELKKACGSGGTAKETSVEIQGDHRERLRPLLAAKGFKVKG